MNEIYLGLGSNLGFRGDNLDHAIRKLNNRGITVTQCSSYIETEPVGGPPQNNYMNAVVKVETDLSPHDLLREVKQIEKEMGRKETVRFGPRIIDIDILLYNNVVVCEDGLNIPHPRMFEREFVIIPLNEIAPHLSERFNYANH